MKFNKIFLAMTILLVVSGVGIAAAEEASVGDHTFTLPDNFKLTNSTDDTTILEQDNEHAIVLMLSDEIESVEDTRASLESKGYTFLGEDTYTVNGNQKIQQENYETDQLTIMAYVIDVGDEKCIITYTIPSTETPPEGDDNPVSTIIGTIE